MAAEGFDEEYDPDFLNQLDQLEAQILSSANPTQLPHQPPPPLRPPPPPPVPYTALPHYDISYSPPRELSQRVQDKPRGPNQLPNGAGSTQITVDSVRQFKVPYSVKEQEIECLKRELGRVSKQLSHLEQECSELRKERDSEKEQLKSIPLHIKSKDAETSFGKNPNLEYGCHIQDPWFPLGCQDRSLSTGHVLSQTNAGISTCKDIGVQTEEIYDSTHEIVNEDLSTVSHRPSKLLHVWSAGTCQKSGVDLVSKLLVSCGKEFAFLFGCLSSNLHFKTTMDAVVNISSCDVASYDRIQSAYSSEAAKVSKLYSMLTKTSNGMARLEYLLEALLDLCRLQNVAVVYSSLCVLHMILIHLTSMDWKSDRRENVMVEEPCCQNNAAEVYQFEFSETGNLLGVNNDEASNAVHNLFSRRLSDDQRFNKKEFWNHGLEALISKIDWVLVFDVMHEIVMKNNEEHIRLEAVSIMVLIVMRTNAYMERDKFGSMMMFQSVSQLLRKETGVGVQKQAVHLLYLLLNCPKLMGMFCSGYKEDGYTSEATNSDAKCMSSFPGFLMIFEGLADCIACSGNGAQELKLRRNAITALAFLASSGKLGFEILLAHRLQRGVDFFSLLMQILLAEMDAEALENGQPPEVFKERTLLIREALILLNRTVSNPKFSTSVLRILTNSRDVACLTIDIANRLSSKVKWLWQTDSITRQIRESEIVDLALVFRKRIFSFLGDR